MHIRESSFGYWSSPGAFLAVAVGASLGIGNSARLPYMMSEYGGVLFLAVYLLCLLVVGIPLLITEWSLGRWMRDDLGAGFRRLAQAGRSTRAWRWLGLLMICCAVIVLSYYSVIAGWSLGYLFRGVAGVLGHLDAEGARVTFLSLARDPERSLAWHTLFMVVTTVIVSYGFRDGIERACRQLLPAVLVLSVLLLALAMIGSDIGAVWHQMTMPDLGRLGWRGALEALYQAFFTLGLGLGAMMMLGGYLPSDVNLVRLAGAVAVIDTLFGLIVGFALLMVLDQAGIESSGGLVFLFQDFPHAIAAGGLGAAIAGLFYGLLFLVTLMAATALLEPVTRRLMERHRQTRVFASVGAAIVIWTLGIGSLLSFGQMADMRVAGQNFFEWMQFLTSFVLVPVGGLFLCVLVARVLPPELSRALWGKRDRVFYQPWLYALRYPARIVLLVVLLHGFGTFHWLAEFWSE